MEVFSIKVEVSIGVASSCDGGDAMPAKPEREWSRAHYELVAMLASTTMTRGMGVFGARFPFVVSGSTSIASDGDSKVS
jgi:hypothetical protein